MPANKVQPLAHTQHLQAGKSFGCLPIVGLLLLTVIVTVGATVWAIQSQLFSRNFKPVELSETEQQTLTQKLDALASVDGGTDAALSSSQSDEPTANLTPELTIGEDADVAANGELKPDSYTEDASKRRIELTQRELNSLLAKNTDLAEQLVVHLSENVASLKLLVDMDPDFPFLGGKTLKVSGGTELSYENGRPVVVMKGVSVWGVPIPNAWLGGLKNIDLVREFGGNDGFWKSLAEGIEDIRVMDGKLLIQLAE